MKRFLQVCLLLAGLVWCVPSWAAITCAQGGPACTSTTVRTCIASTTSCNITVASTHAGALEIMAVNTSTATGTASAPTTDGTWAVATASLGTQTNRTEIVYNLNATGGATTITCKWTASVQTDCEFFEFTGSIANGWTFDTANGGSDASCTSCAGVALTLATSNNYALVQSAYDNSSTLTAINQSYNIAVNATSGNAGAYKIATVAGTTPNWTTGSTTLAVGGVGIYETPAAAGGGGFNKARKLEVLEARNSEESN